ncbi:tRNA (adenosine(37)-N6)-dimethylallyltransferase MiaA [Megasphaera micronuciformis]|uniref:tRNA dimethylallyltransferase n=1 Tax=Megasphaera micronuciformis F0359 TaxID=706434 RepID=E2ZDH8_9FIRM|nr:tRNA (adenosine(37)-N6)-dimethylallyltransferase MiaA [Megasphaera micronuciformis]EFQ03540.1 tRNA dimethylallyltransferase [Megasphaera micronuciformis F0359]
MNEIIAIIGPTAVGKTALSFKLAERFQTELVSADAYQVYKGMDIGTAKATKDELATYRHHLIDIIEPNEDFSAAAFQEAARTTIEDLHERGKIPILVGGTGLYVQSLLEGYEFKAKRHSKEERQAALNRIAALSEDELKAYITEKTGYEPPDWHELLSNSHRLVRLVGAIEKGDGAAAVMPQKAGGPLYHAFVIGLSLPRQVLYERIEKRIDAMIEAGWINEVQQLLQDGVSPEAQAMKAIGYKELVLYLDGQLSLEAASELIKKRTRHFAKRQMTWFKRMPYIRWYEKDDFVTEVELASAVIQDIETKWGSKVEQKVK